MQFLEKIVQFCLITKYHLTIALIKFNIITLDIFILHFCYISFLLEFCKEYIKISSLWPIFDYGVQ